MTNWRQYHIDIKPLYRHRNWRNIHNTGQDTNEQTKQQTMDRQTDLIAKPY